MKKKFRVEQRSYQDEADRSSSTRPVLDRRAKIERVWAQIQWKYAHNHSHTPKAEKRKKRKKCIQNALPPALVERDWTIDEPFLTVRGQSGSRRVDQCVSGKKSAKSRKSLQMRRVSSLPADALGQSEIGQGWLATTGSPAYQSSNHRRSNLHYKHRAVRVFGLLGCEFLTNRTARYSL